MGCSSAKLGIANFLCIITEILICGLEKNRGTWQHHDQGCCGRFHHKVRVMIQRGENRSMACTVHSKCCYQSCDFCVDHGHF